MALNQACKLDLAPRNVAALEDFPAETAEIQPYTPEQAQRFLEAAKGHRLGALFSAALAFGLRKGFVFTSGIGTPVEPEKTLSGPSPSSQPNCRACASMTFGTPRPLCCPPPLVQVA
jgi:hypothetical protein